MGVADELMEIERGLAAGHGDEYARVLHDDALVVVPGAVLTAAECVRAMDESPGWDDVTLGVPTLVESLATATVVYAFRGARGSRTYRATVSSTYTRDGDGRWRLLLHQQTPLDAETADVLPAPNQLNLVVDDIGRSTAFYRDLGWDADEPTGPHAEIRFGDRFSVEQDERGSVALWNSGSPSEATAASVLSVPLPARDAVDELWARMTDLGHESRQRPFDAFWGSRYAILADPDGHQVGLMSPRSDAHRAWPPEPAPR